MSKSDIPDFGLVTSIKNLESQSRLYLNTPRMIVVRLCACARVCVNVQMLYIFFFAEATLEGALAGVHSLVHS